MPGKLDGKNNGLALDLDLVWCVVQFYSSAVLQFCSELDNKNTSEIEFSILNVRDIFISYEFLCK